MWFYYSIPRRRRRRTRTHSSHPIIIISTRLLLGRRRPRFRRNLIWDMSVIETNGFTGGGAARSQCRPLTTIHRRPKYINGNGDHLWWRSLCMTSNTKTVEDYTLRWAWTELGTETETECLRKSAIIRRLEGWATKHTRAIIHYHHHKQTHQERPRTRCTHDSSQLSMIDEEEE